MILPWKNEKDLEETPEEVRNEMKFHFVHEMSEVLDIALVKKSSEAAA